MTDRLKRIAAAVTLASMLMVPVMSAQAALTNAQMQSILDLLSSFGADATTLGNVESALKGEATTGTTPTTGTISGIPTGYTFTRNLSVGSTGDDVKYLQILLNSSADTQVAATGGGSSGNETSYFGNLTKAAVVKFQEKYAAEVLASYGLTSGTGFFGSTSRAKSNALVAAAPATPTTPTTPTDPTTPTTPTDPTTPTAPTTGPLSVAVGPNNPVAGTLGASSAYNTVLEVQVNGGTAGANVTSVTVERFGLSVDTNIDGVLIVDANGNRHGNVVTLASNVATIPFSSDPIVAPAGGSATFKVQVHVDSDATAGTIGFKVTGMNDNPAGLPVSGNLYSLSATTGILGAVTVGAVSQTTASINVDIGQTDHTVTKFRIAETSGNENVSVSKLTLFQNGTTTENDLVNWDLVDPVGNVLATVAQPAGRVVTFDLSSSPYVIAKGTSKDLTVRVDVVSGSSRTGQIIIQSDYDLVVKGASTNLGILPTIVAIGGSADTAFPVGDIADGTAGYNHLTVSAGTMTLNKSGTSPSGTFGIGETSVTLATWELNAQGEDIQIQRADLEIEGTTVAADFAGTVQLVTEGGQTLWMGAASTAALYDEDASANDVVTFSIYYTIPAGSVLKVSLVADASSTITSGDTAIGGLGDVYYKRMTSGTFGTASAAVHVAGNTRSASSATLTVVNNAALGNVTVIEGQSDVLLGSYLLQTSSSEGVNISSFPVRVAIGGEAAIAAVSNLKLKRADTGAQIGTTKSSLAAVAGGFSTNTFTVSGQLNVPASTTIQVDVYGNLSAAAADGGDNDTYITSILTDTVSGTGATSGTTITGPTTTVTGRTVVASQGGTLTVAVETSGAAASAFYTSGLTGVEMARVKLSATVEDMAVERLEIRTLNGSANIAKVKLLGTGLDTDPSVNLTAGSAVFTFASGSEITVPAYGSRVLTAVVDTTGVGTTVAGNFGVIGFGTANARGASSGITVQERLTGTVEVAGTNDFAGAVGDVIYFTVAGDGAGANDNTPGFRMVTAISDTDLTVANSLTLEGVANNSWAAGDIITTLTEADNIAGDANAGVTYSVGDIVYVYDADDNEAGFAIVTTAVASGSAISGLGFSPAGDIAIAAAGDRVTKFTGANALVGNTMRYEEVEPTITKNASSPTGSGNEGSQEVVAVFDVKANGFRDMTFNSLTVEKSGNNSPARYVTDLSLWNGATQLARVANTTFGVTGDAANANAATTLVMCSGADPAAGEIGGVTAAEAATLAIGDRVTLRETAGGTAVSTGTITNKTGTLTTCDGAGITLTFDSTMTVTGAMTAASIENTRVHFDANQAQTNDVVLAEQTVTAGQTVTLTVKANTQSVRTGLGAGVSGSFSVAIPGTAGPLQVGTTQIEGLNWDYTPLGGGAATYKTEGDSYPVNGNTLSY